MDYILVNKKWRNTVKDAQAYNSFSSTGSDHRVVIAKLKLSLRCSKTPKRDNTYDWSTLQHEKNLQDLYTVTVRNRYAELQGEEETITETCDHLIKENSESAEKHIPPKGKHKKKLTAKDPRIIAARERMNKASFTYQKDSTETNRLNLQDEKSNFQKAYNQVMEEDLDQMIREVEEANTDSAGI